MNLLKITKTFQTLYFQLNESRKMTRLIAIFKPKEVIRDYSYSDVLNDSITDWSEVTEDEYRILQAWATRHGYVVIERIDKTENFFPKTIASAIEEAKKEQEKIEQAEQLAKKKKLERELKRKAKAEQQEKELLEALKEKYKLVVQV